MNLPQQQAMAKIVDIAREHFHGSVIVVIGDAQPTIQIPPGATPVDIHYQVSGSPITGLGLLDWSHSHLLRSIGG